MTGGTERTGNLADAIFEDLLKKILKGEIAPGERLRPERDLAVDYGTNRNTLREALRGLEQLRLVSPRQGQGITVADFRKIGNLSLVAPFIRHTTDARERMRVIVDLLLARTQILEMAVGLAAQRGTQKDFERVDAAGQDLRDAFARRDRDALVEGEIALITALVDAAGSLMVQWTANTLLEVYRSLLSGARALWIFEPTFPEFVTDLAEAVRRREPARAVALARDYYGRVDGKLLQTLDKIFPGLAADTARPDLPQDRHRGTSSPGGRRDG